MSFMARTVTIANGSQTTFPVSFPLPPITGRAGVVVYIHAQGALDPGAPKVAGTDFNWVSDGQISTPTPPANGQAVDIRRATTDNALDNTPNAGGALRSSELVQNDTQLLYITQELQDEDALRLTQLEAEATTRAGADAAEANSRSLADVALGDRITDEATARAQGDSDEAAARNTAVTNETAQRIAAVNAEAVARTNAITASAAKTLRAPENLDIMPAAGLRASKFPQFTATGLGITLYSTTALAGTLAPDLTVILGNSFKGNPGSPGEGYSTTAALATALNTASNLDDFYLTEGKKRGKFVFYTVAGYLLLTGRDLVTDVAGDPTHGFFIPAASDATGAAGAAMRDVAIITPYHFGVIGDGVTDDRAAMQAFNDFFFSRIRSGLTANWNVTVGIAGTFIPGPPSDVTTVAERWKMFGDLYVKQLTPGTFETVVLNQYFQKISWNGGIGVEGAEGWNHVPWATRTCGIGITMRGASVSSFNTLRSYGFWYCGILIVSRSVSPVSNSNDCIWVNLIESRYNGSGYSGANWSLLANWSGLVRTGGNRLVSQYDTITVDAFPDAALETYYAIGAQPVYVNINGNWHYVKAWDRVGGTINVYPWVDAASVAAGSGTLRWCFGGGLMTIGIDSQIIGFGQLFSQQNGMGLNSAGLYGVRTNVCNLAANGIGLNISHPNGISMGNSLDGFYTEGNDSSIVQGSTSNSTWSYINSSMPLDVSKIQVISPRDTATDSCILGLGSTNPFTASPEGTMNYLRISANGVMHQAVDNPLDNTHSNSGGAIFDDHTAPPVSKFFTLNSHSIKLTPMDQAFNRLFGYRGNIWTYIGTGANGAPTGNITVQRPTATYSCTKNGTTTVSTASTAGLRANMPISGTGIPGGATIASVTDATHFELSAAATDSLTSTLTVTGSVNGAFVDLVYSGFFGVFQVAVVLNDKWQLDWTALPITGWRLKGSASINPASLASGASAIVGTITVAGAVLGDRFVASFGIDLQGLIPSAYVSAADTVKVVLANLTGGAIDLGNSTVTVSKVA